MLFLPDFYPSLKRHFEFRITDISVTKSLEMWSRRWSEHIQVLGMLTESQLGDDTSPGVGMVQVFLQVESRWWRGWGLSCQCSKQWEERLLTIDIDSSGLRPELQHSQGMEGKGRGSILCEIPGLFRGCPVLLSALHGGCQVMFSLWHCYRLLSSRPNSPLAHDREKYILPLTLQ